MARNKGLAFQHEQKDVSHYQGSRKYQTNIKNIAKLRNRYSLEPHRHLEKMKKECERTFMVTVKSVHEF